MVSSEPANIWEGMFPSFPAADAEACGPGFEGEVYLVRTLASARDCLDALSRGAPIPAFHKQRSTVLPVVAATLLRSRQSVRILDFGGALGIGYMTLLESIPSASARVSYTVVEGRGICEAGKRLFEPGAPIEFVDKLPANERYDLVHSASALQYVEDWRAIISALGSYGSPYLLLSDVFAGNIPSFVSLQNYYGSRIRHWFLNLDELMGCLVAAGYELVMRSYVSSRRLGSYDGLPMDNFPSSHRLSQTLHLLLGKAA